ncbi:MAG: glutaredoxin family protein [Arenimonas sp.]|nr:glutaredoxin family protein [Arenimonas sp.]
MLTLIQRDDCALCDDAWEILHAADVRDFESQFIDGDAELESRYGDRIPVLSDDSGRELDWPFSADTLRAWLALSAPESARS